MNCKETTVYCIDGVVGCGATSCVQAYENMGYAVVYQGVDDLHGLSPRWTMAKIAILNKWVQEILELKSQGVTRIVTDMSPFTASFYCMDDTQCSHLLAYAHALVKEMLEVHEVRFKTIFLDVSLEDIKLGHCLMQVQSRGKNRFCEKCLTKIDKRYRSFTCWNYQWRDSFCEKKLE